MVKCHTLINRRNKCLLIVFIVLIGWIIFRPKAYTYSLNDKEKEMLIMLSQHPETRYFGFYSIELPADYKPTGNGYVHTRIGDDPCRNKATILSSFSAIYDTI